MEKNKRYELADIVAKASIISACFAILAITIGSPLYLGNKIDNLRSDMYEEMKDFHGRLCAIEERNKGK